MNLSVLRQHWASLHQSSVPTLLYHLTDKVDFKLDPKKRPENNTTLGGTWEPGIFLARGVEVWVNGYGYWRPWVVEFSVPSDLDSLEGVIGQGYGGEVYVPARYFDKLRINRVIPLDAYCREEYGSWGWVEEDDGKTFDTEQPIPEAKSTFDPTTTWNDIYPWKGYRYPGDARQTDPAWRQRYTQRVRKYQRSHRGAYASLHLQRHAELGGRRLWWRVHPAYRDFSPEAANSTPINNFFNTPPARGFSAVGNPWHVWTYCAQMGWLSESGPSKVWNDDVIGFTGTMVTTEWTPGGWQENGRRDASGEDGEPLVIPDMRIVQRFSWTEFERELLTTPFPRGPLHGRAYDGEDAIRNGSWNWTEFAKDLLATKGSAWRDTDRAAGVANFIIEHWLGKSGKTSSALGLVDRKIYASPQGV